MKEGPCQIKLEFKSWHKDRRVFCSFKLIQQTFPTFLTVHSSAGDLNWHFSIITVCEYVCVCVCVKGTNGQGIRIWRLHGPSLCSPRSKTAIWTAWCICFEVKHEDLFLRICNGKEWAVATVAKLPSHRTEKMNMFWFVVESNPVSRLLNLNLNWYRETTTYYKKIL